MRAATTPMIMIQAPIIAFLTAVSRRERQANRKASARQRTLDRHRARQRLAAFTEGEAILFHNLEGARGAGAETNTGDKRGSKAERQAALRAASMMADQRRAANERRAQEKWHARNSGKVSDTTGARGKDKLTAPKPLARVEDGARGHIYGDSAAHAARLSRDLDVSYEVFWQSTTDQSAVISRAIDDVSRIARRAAGKYGHVSATSIEEAVAAARHAVLVRFAPGGQFDARLAARLAKPSQEPLRQAVRRVAIGAGVRSLLNDLSGGQTGRTEGLRGIRRAAVETLDTLVRGGTDEDSEPLARSRARALDLVLAVRRARTARLGETPRADGWQARQKLVIRRFRRVATVLSLVAQGESLEVACEVAGFGFDAGEGRSQSFTRAFDETGVRTMVCNRAGRGAIGDSVTRSMV